MADDIKVIIEAVLKDKKFKKDQSGVPGGCLMPD